MIKAIIFEGLALLFAASALAQTVESHAGHTMPDTEAAAPMNHGKMNMTAPAAAGGNAMPAMDHSKMAHGGMVMTPTSKGISRTNVSPAEAALQAFSNAIEVGNRDLAIARLSPDLKVVEDGVEESYSDYVGGHLAGDIAFQKTVKTVLLERAVSTDSTTRVKITSKIRMISNRSDRMIDTVVDETAVLAKLSCGWKIERLEWISEK